MRRGAIHPVGLALTLTGAAATLLSLFLPLRQTTAFGTVADNTLVQATSGLELIAWAICLLVWVYRYTRRGYASWGVLVLAALIIFDSLYLAVNDDLFTLYALDPTTGEALAGGLSERASTGIALYVSGFGGVLASIGGWMMWRHPEPAGEGTTTSAVPSTKQCPDCAERVQAAARVCRFCGYSFAGESSTGP